jgi:hypothetical protein
LRIATFNVNGINGRLPVLLHWLAETGPDVVCLQELKAADERFPAAAIRAAGYGADWHGLPGDPGDTHSRYLGAAVAGILSGCLTCPTAIRRPAQSSTTAGATRPHRPGRSAYGQATLMLIPTPKPVLRAPLAVHPQCTRVPCI